MKLKSIIIQFFLPLSLLFGSSLIAQNTQNKEIKVLFVGNSFTFYFNLPQVVSTMAETQGFTINTKQSTVSGSSLEQHWKNENGTQTRKMIENEKWDYVVFNNYSLSPINNPDKFMDYSKRFADLVRTKGAEPIFMMTWAYKSNPLMQTELTKMYKKLAENTKSDYVPCGPLFADARKFRPDLELFHDDKHPSSNGTYLLGLAFFKYFTGKSTAKIPGNLETKDRNGEKLYLIFMDETDADFLQQIVDETDFKTLK